MVIAHEERKTDDWINITLIPSVIMLILPAIPYIGIILTKEANDRGLFDNFKDLVEGFKMFD